MKRLAPILLVAVALLAYAAWDIGRSKPAPTGASGRLLTWSQYGGDPQRTGQGTGRGAVGKLAWTYQAGDQIEGSPAVGQTGLVYTWSGDGVLHAIDGKTGRERLTALTRNYSTIQLLLKKQLMVTSAMHFASPSPAGGRDGTVYIGSWDGYLYALDGATGARRWRCKVGRLTDSSVALSDRGVLYTTAWASILIAVDARTGRKLWTFVEPTNMDLWSPAVGPDGTVYAGGNCNRLYALDGRTGAVKWDYAIPSMCGEPMVGTDGTIYMGSSDGTIYAFRPSGKLKWSVSVQRTMAPRLALGRCGLLYVSTMSMKHGCLYALDTATGAKRWTFDTGSRRAGCAVASDGTLYVACTPGGNGKLCALDGKTGRVKWSCPIDPGQHSMPAIGADGTIYIGSTSGKLHAIR